jgi:4-hydroxythreonine-4-phosphate dehydrogenase
MIIGITVGEPAGIGPEVAVKAVLKEEIKNICSPVIIGSGIFIKQFCEKYFKDVCVNEISSFGSFKKDAVNVYSVSNLKFDDIKLGQDSVLGGKESSLYLESAWNLIQDKKINAIVTCPISKKSISMAGFKFPGHTEFFAEKANIKRYLMFFYSENIKVALVTRHVPLNKAASLITQNKILEVIDIVYENRKVLLKKDDYKMAVCALNPHASDGGIIGNEEKEIIIPAVEKAKKKGINVEGPFASDALFTKYKKYDFIIAMYHDQGLIPFKMLEFESGVNVTLGLPLIRTSVDHGTAYDIVGKGIANSGSLEAAIKLAVEMAKR